MQAVELEQSKSNFPTSNEKDIVEIHENVEHHFKDIMCSLYNMQKLGRFCDFSLILPSSVHNGLLEPNETKVHKNVLAAVSRKVRKMHERSMLLNEKVTCTGLQRVVEFIYTGSIKGIETLPLEHIENISFAAASLDVMKCIKYVKTSRPDVLVKSNEENDDIIDEALAPPDLDQILPDEEIEVTEVKKKPKGSDHRSKVEDGDLDTTDTDEGGEVEEDECMNPVSKLFPKDEATDSTYNKTETISEEEKKKFFKQLKKCCPDAAVLKVIDVSSDSEPD